MKNKVKKIVALLLSVMIIATIVPVSALADGYSFLPPFDSMDHPYARNLSEDSIIKKGPDYVTFKVSCVRDAEVSTGNNQDVEIVIEYSKDQEEWTVGTEPVQNVQGEYPEVKVTGLSKATTYYFREVIYFKNAPEVKLVSDTPFAVKTTNSVDPKISSIKAIKAKVKWIPKKTVSGYWAADGTWMKGYTVPAHWQTSWTYKITLKQKIDADYIWVYDDKVSSNRFKYNGKKTFYVTVGHNGKLIGKKYSVYIRGELDKVKSKKSNTVKGVKVCK